MLRFITIISIIILLFIPHDLKASHGMGGEITWECLGNGQYKFRFIFYRDCNGINAPTTIDLTTTVPGVPTISMTRVSQIDISFDGYQANGATPCLTCSSVNGGAGGVPSMVQKNVYESAPVTLSGVPPPTGWQFYWGECCRSLATFNIATPGAIGFRYRAIMYPFSLQNVSPCFDSSPFFVEKPTIGFCVGIPQQFSYSAYDVDGDSLVYSWITPIDEFGNLITYTPGYSVNSQMPSVTQNPNNLPLLLDSQTGMISYQGYTAGNFNLSLKVTAYKCGVKVAEVFREFDVNINNNCPQILSGNNAPPEINPPFADPITGLFTEYTDTVRAGSFVGFDLVVADFDIFNNGSPQSITVEAAGGSWGTNFMGQLIDCEFPPCPQFTQTLPHSSPLGTVMNFVWQTSNNHLLDTNCTRTGVYLLNVKACDNYCPTNACITKTIRIVLTPSALLDPPIIRCAQVNPDGGVTLNWSPSTSIDSLGLFRSYRIYVSNGINGTYQLVDSVTTGINANTYTHPGSALSSLFGNTANNLSFYYKITTVSDNLGFEESGFSNRMGSIAIQASQGPGHSALLEWNKPSLPVLNSQATHYKIYREYPVGNWILIDSTNTETYEDLFTQTLCSDSVSYRVEISDSAGCTSVSGIRKFIINSSSSGVVISPPNPSTCGGQNIILTASTGTAYLWSTSNTTQSISVNQPGTYTVTVTQANGCSGQSNVTVTNSPSLVPNITGTLAICQGSTTALNAGNGFAFYLWNTGATTQTINVSNAGQYIVTVTNSNGCFGIDTVDVTVNPNPVPLITGNTTICQGGTTTLSVTGGYTSYLWSTGANTGMITVGIQGTYTITVTDANGCSGSTSTSITVNPIPTPSISGNLTFCQGGSTVLDGGAGYPSYQWSGAGAGSTQTIVATVPGTYTLTVIDPNGCSGSTSVNVSSGAVIVNIGGNTNLCQGQSAILNAGGGFNTYQWSNGASTQSITVSTSGVYSVTVTNSAGCTGTDQAIVTVNSNPTVILNGTAFCQGGFVTLDAGGFWGNYLWNTGASTQTIAVSTPGIYTVTVTNAFGCTGSDSALMTMYTLPPAVATAAGNTSFCIGDSVLLNATAGYPGYLWYRHTNPIQPNITTQGFYVKSMGNYYCRVTDSNGCTNISNAIFIEAPCIPIGDPGERDIVTQYSEEISIFPNPSFDNFIVTANYVLPAETSWKVFDLSGREVSCVIERINEFELIIENLPVGIFILKIDNKNIRIIKME